MSEYRIESGLNCGGHAFATDGYLLGPVLVEFKDRREELRTTTQEILNQELLSQERYVPKRPLSLVITAQGGVGTQEEHEFLMDYYKLDSVGWGTPFLLVPEATTVDGKTLERLAEAKEEDLYLSDISPLGVPFNNLRNNTKDEEKETLINSGRPGSVCPKRFVALNKEFSEKGICTASRQYQRLKIKELDNENLLPKTYQKKHSKIIEKTCTCVGLGTSALLVHNIDTKVEGEGVSICPGPNMAYYSKVMSLKEITDHIYGRRNVITRIDRPNIFIKELNIYIDYLKNMIEDAKNSLNKRQEKYLVSFTNNMKEGVSYYNKLFRNLEYAFKDTKHTVLKELEISEKTLQLICLEIDQLISSQ